MDRELNDGHAPQPLGESTTSDSDQTGPKPTGIDLMKNFKNKSILKNPREIEKR
jgi:hypothetical protein